MYTILWNLEACYTLQKSPVLVLFLSQINPVHILTNILSPSGLLICEHFMCITWLLTPWSRRVLPEKLKRPKLLKKFPAFYGVRRFITAFTRGCHLSLSWAIFIQSMPPHPTSRRSILILSSHLRLGLSSGLLPSGFPTKTLYAPLLSPYAPNVLFYVHFSSLIAWWRVSWSVLLDRYCSGNKMKKNELRGACCMYGEQERCVRGLGG